MAILAATVAAFLLVPAAQAFAENQMTVNVTGTGGGEVKGAESPYPGGNPPVACSYASPGPASGVCETEMAELEPFGLPGFVGVALVATPAPGSEFTGWTAVEGEFLNACTTAEGEACFVYTEEGENAKVIANFNLLAPRFTLTVTKETGGGPGGTVVSSPAGIECGGTCSAEYKEQTKVTLTASPAVNSTFLSWKGCEKGGAIGHTCTVTMDKAKGVVAKFAPTQPLTVEKAGAGSGSVKSSPSGISCDLNCTQNVASFIEGASVTLTAVPTKSNEFTGWSGGGCSGTGTCTVAMSAAQTVTAEFGVTKYSLTITKSGGGTGAIKAKPALSCGTTCSSATSSFYKGTEVEITATPSKGSSFEWSGVGGTCTGTTSPCKVTMSGAEHLVASFG
jgi:hypothetical protein